MDRTTLTAALKPLERRRLVKVRVDPTDRRGRLVALTAKGRRLLVSAVPVWEHHHRKLEEQLPSPKALREYMGALAAAADR
jgi:DNA-binding MarR family transcriptional regulator